MDAAAPPFHGSTPHAPAPPPLPRTAAKAASAGQAARRRTLADVTNLKPSVAPSPDVAPDVARLMKEKAAMAKLLEERSQFVELSMAEVQRMRAALKGAQQQNLSLAQMNSKLLAEHNSGKERVKVLEHQLACTAAVLRARTTELEEIKKLITMAKHKGQEESLNIYSKQEGLQQESLNNVEEEEEGKAVDADSGPPPCPESCKKPDEPSRRRSLRLRSLGPAPVTNKTTLAVMDAGRRKSLRPRSGSGRASATEQPESQLDDAKTPAKSSLASKKRPSSTLIARRAPPMASSRSSIKGSQRG